MRSRRPIFGLLIVLLTVMALAPLSASNASAAAPDRPGTSTAYHALPLTGTLPDGGTFVGTLNLQSFTHQGRTLLANGTVSGTLTDALGHVLGTVTDQAVSLPVAIPGATCQILHLTLGPLDLNLLGLTVHLDRVVLDITALSGPGNLLGNLLCAIAHLLDHGGGIGRLVGLLNDILDALFPSVPIAGTVSNGGRFVGALTLQNFSVTPGGAPAVDQLSAAGLLSGTLTNALGQIIGTVTGVAVNLLAAIPGATCQILHLTLGPLDLNLLGLTVHLDRVLLDITAHSGPGRLLGNLLCAVAHLLDIGGPLSQIAALLNQILALLY